MFKQIAAASARYASGVAALPWPSQGGSGRSFALDGTASMEVSYTIGANYIVEIPSSINLNNSAEFRITASSMNIGENQSVTVSIDGNSTYESDGNFYLHSAGSKIPCEIVVGATPITGIDYDVARFEQGSLTNSVLDAVCFTPGTGLPGTYTGTLYFRISLA